MLLFQQLSVGTVYRNLSGAQLSLCLFIRRLNQLFGFRKSTV